MAWTDKDQVLSWRKLVNFQEQYHLRVFKDGEIHDIQKYFCDPWLREMSNEQLIGFLGKNKSKIIKR